MPAGAKKTLLLYGSIMYQTRLNPMEELVDFGYLKMPDFYLFLAQSRC